MTSSRLEKKENLDINEDSLCPISLEKMTNPYITSCGHSFQKENIDKHLTTSNKCPCCRSDVKGVAPNYALKSILLDYYQQQDLIKVLSTANTKYQLMVGSMSTPYQVNKKSKINTSTDVTIKQLLAFEKGSINRYRKLIFYFVMKAYYRNQTNKHLNKLQSLNQELVKLKTAYHDSSKSIQEEILKINKFINADDIFSAKKETKVISLDVDSSSKMQLLLSKTMNAVESTKKEVKEINDKKSNVVSNLFKSVYFHEKTKKTLKKSSDELKDFCEEKMHFMTKLTEQEKKRHQKSFSLTTRLIENCNEKKDLTKDEQIALDKALINSIKTRDIKLSEKLLQQGADPNVKSLLLGERTATLLLIANPNSMPETFLQPIFMLFLNSENKLTIPSNITDYLELLMKFKVDVNVRNAQPIYSSSDIKPEAMYEYNPLMMCCDAFSHTGLPIILKAIPILVKAGIDINATSLSNNYTALHCLAWAENQDTSEVIKFLIQHGADVRISDRVGNNPLAYANTCFSITSMQKVHPQTVNALREALEAANKLQNRR